MQKYQLVHYGHAALRQKAEPVKEINEEVLHLIREMITIMNAHNGIGLAANQVGVLLRIFVCTVVGLDQEGYPVFGDPKVYINPIITVLDSTEWVDSEGCLSVPKVYADIPRPTKIQVEALNEKGETFIEDKEGWMARPILHENDHLNGVLFFDRTPPYRRQSLQPQLKKIKKKYNGL